MGNNLMYLKTGNDKVGVTSLQNVLTKDLEAKYNKVINSVSNIKGFPKSVIMEYYNWCNEGLAYDDVYIGGRLNKGDLLGNVRKLISFGKGIINVENLKPSNISCSYVSLVDVEGDGRFAEVTFFVDGEDQEIVRGNFNLHSCKFDSSSDILKYKNGLSQLESALENIITFVCKFGNICAVNVYGINDLFFSGLKGNMYVGIKSGVPSAYLGDMDSKEGLYSIGIFLS